MKHPPIRLPGATALPCPPIAMGAPQAGSGAVPASAASHCPWGRGATGGKMPHLYLETPAPPVLHLAGCLTPTLPLPVLCHAQNTPSSPTRSDQRTCRDPDTCERVTPPPPSAACTHVLARFLPDPVHAHRHTWDTHMPEGVPCTSTHAHTSPQPSTLRAELLWR